MIIFALYMYFSKTPHLLKKFFPHYLWDVATKEKKLYLTFDDGPHATATPFVLEQLKKYTAKATFFCIGKNVIEEPGVYKQILEDGHSVGNHTHNHLNGWKTNVNTYIDNIFEASKYIQSNLFRPPYGRITRQQGKALMSENADKIKYNIVMWDVLSGDFDTRLKPEICASNVINNAKAGSIIVFHDSAKALNNLRYALPLILKYFTERGFVFSALQNNIKKGPE